MRLEQLCAAPHLDAIARTSPRNNYVAEFLSLRAAPDILEAVNPLGKRAVKEITESMAVVRRLRGLVLAEPNKYVFYDLCAGNALTSVIAAHLLPIKEAVAIDKRPRERNWGRVNKFSYVCEDINRIRPDYFADSSIIIGVHACRNRAEKVIRHYLESEASHLVLMPCCSGKLSKGYLFPGVLDNYQSWSMQLAHMAGGTVNIDFGILSPKNAIITASKV